MSLLTRLTDLVAANPDAKRIVMVALTRSALLKECAPVVYPWREWTVGEASRGKMRFWGLSVVPYLGSMEFCRNCGANIEPNVCSYCKTPSAVIQLEN